MSEMFGYNRAFLRIGMRELIGYGIIRVQQIRQPSKGYVLDKEFFAYRQLVALLDRLAQHEQAKWKARVRQIEVRRPKALTAAK